MLKWIVQCPPNILLLRRNHEEEFIAYVDLMLLLDRREELEADFSSNAKTGHTLLFMLDILKKRRIRFQTSKRTIGK